ncbi:MAG: manganese efflux pump MntP family protein [Bacteroides sp.]|nr:manganese efflux pump MntP family protein [Prevotella sp.]MCM1408618.1 manganese efflux pump MntP family protein [Treponema brennaborense]MCM1468894.1 manganese efflux pump MntP family protein [Bacteroides sp.]
MGFIELLLIGIGLSMDAFAAAVCEGLKMRKPDYRLAALIALFFGGAQALMPLAGYVLGRQFESYIAAVDHWIAFFLLAFIGGKMIAETIQSFREEQSRTEENQDAAGTESNAAVRIRELLLLAVATSIDALAVGITFAFLKVRIAYAAAVIGLTTAAISFAGTLIGKTFGARLKTKAGLFGGVILAAIGVKILAEHLFF